MPHPQREQLIREAQEHARSGRAQQAADIYQALLAADADDVEVLQRLGVLALGAGQSAEAVALLERATELKPDDAQLWSDAGRAYGVIGELDNAHDAYSNALRLDPSLVEARNNFGVTLAQLGRADEAIATWRALLDEKPDHVSALGNLARVFLDTQNRPDLALPPALRWHELRPGAKEPMLMLAAVNCRIARLDDALAALDQVVQLEPIAAHFDLRGLTQLQAGLVAEGIASFRRGLELEPQSLGIRSNLLIALHYDPATNPQDLFAEHLEWARVLRSGGGGGGGEGAVGDVSGGDGSGGSRTATHRNNRDPDRALRIGYVSGDFNQHPVESFIRPIFTARDRRRTSVFCYYTHPQVDDATRRMRATADAWRDVANIDDAALEQLVRDDGIDILVDLAGHMGSNRLPLFARRPAPVQVTYLGYCDTTGLSEIDYRLTDAICDPPGEPRRHSEELLRLPGGFSCFAPPMNSPPVAPEPPVIARGTITFGSMHGLAKLNDGVLDLWADLLRALPTARLLVCRHELAGRVRQRLLDRFAARGIGGDRLEIRGNLRGGRWLPVYDEIDILLDVFPWSGHTTTCESLWMGVPVVTLAGRTHAGRMVASVLTSCGLPQWIAASPQEYIRIAGELAGDVERLRDLRRTLRQRFAASRAMDERAFTGELEEAYRLMWRKWCTKDGEISI